MRPALQRFAVSAAIVILIGGATHKIHASDRHADLVLRNGAVYTVDASRSWASSVAVIGDRIKYVGNDADVKDYIGPDTQIIELEGRMLLPGFQDGHVHPQYAEFYAGLLRLDDIDDMELVSERILEYAKAHPELPWIEGAGMDDETFIVAVKNPRQFLDELVPDRPVVITSTTVFRAWVNSRTIEVTGITAETPDPPNGSIVRDTETGEPTGTLLNRAIENLVNSFRPVPSPEQILAHYRHALSKYSANGVTAIMDAAFGEFALASEVTAYIDLASANELKHRVRLCFFHSSGFGVRGNDGQQISDFVAARKKIQERFPDGQVRADCVKLFLDGSLSVDGVALLEDYADRPGFRGMPNFEYERLEKHVANLESEGFQIKAHSSGSRSTRELIDAVEAMQRKAGKPSDLRHHVAHASIVHPDDIARMRRLGMPVEVTPSIRGGTYFLESLGPERTEKYTVPFNSFIQNGVVVGFGNDWIGSNNDRLSILRNIEIAVTKLRPGDTSTDIEKIELFKEHERIPLPAAIAAYTINGAYLMHNEEESGSIEVGKFADFVVLDKNMFDVPVHMIHKINVDMTIFGGELVYERK